MFTQTQFASAFAAIISSAIFVIAAVGPAANSSASLLI